MWCDADQVRDRCGVRKHAACHAPDQCNAYDARGLKVSPGSLGQDLLIKREIRNGPSKALVFYLKTLHLFELVRAHAALILAPAVVGERGDAKPPHGIDPSIPLHP